MAEMRVAVFFTWDVSLALWQQKGLLQREIRLYQELAKQGVAVTFFSWGGAEDDVIARDLAPAIKTVSLYKFIPRPRSKALRALLSLWAPLAVRAEISQADILKTNQMWGGWVAVIARLISRKKLLVRCGFELYDFTIRHGHGRLRRAFVWLLSKMTYAAADRICVATAEDRSFVIRHFRQRPDKIAIHPNWIDTNFFAPQFRPQQDQRILYVGRLTAQKNVGSLIEALAGTGYGLDIAGDGELRAALSAQAQERGVDVRFLGSLPNDDLPPLYNSYPVFVLPSHYEGNPKTLLEAMACGRAVVGTAVPGIASVIAPEQSGLLCAPEASSLRTAVARLMGDAGLRGRLGTAARAQIIENQTLDSLVQRELACYRVMMGYPR